ncbi:hypothetical protein FA09DRAFT_189344 [Tilletiopsis washingtonensis]|uniref:Uncharacterized protein n=1 Tax=Tilletiopsis washingtonensis TaxID=58919 RepID=A0A316ZJQ8_9BASI|nr:hypothetical protein FA09DRAFT_189344 [Tilletiopsis washingtonensis]PWO00524.1 hypothetical protein FA09DRAFT_189344 [Tilletiopsis washingtonensis]
MTGRSSGAAEKRTAASLAEAEVRKCGPRCDLAASVPCPPFSLKEARAAAHRSCPPPTTSPPIKAFAQQRNPHPSTTQAPTNPTHFQHGRHLGCSPPRPPRHVRLRVLHLAHRRDHRLGPDRRLQQPRQPDWPPHRLGPLPALVSRARCLPISIQLLTLCPSSVSAGRTSS